MPAYIVLYHTLEGLGKWPSIFSCKVCGSLFLKSETIIPLLPQFLESPQTCMTFFTIFTHFFRGFCDFFLCKSRTFLVPSQCEKTKLISHIHAVWFQICFPSDIRKNRQNCFCIGWRVVETLHHVRFSLVAFPPFFQFLPTQMFT